MQASPIKVSRPQALTVANLTKSEIQKLIQEHPTRPSILQPSEQFLPPSIPLYLPDPERNKSTDDYYLLATYTDDTPRSPSNEQPTKLKLPLDVYIQPPPPALEDQELARQVEQAEKDRQSYSYNNRFDYYFPVQVVYDENQKYGEKELQLMELQPPIEGTEPNYYATKPKKLPKKYRPGKKEKTLPESDEGLVPIDNDGLVLEDQNNAYVTSQPVERFAPAPSFRQLTEDDLNTGEYIPKYKQADAVASHESTAPSVFASEQASKVNNERRNSGELLSSESAHNRVGYRQDDDDENIIGVQPLDSDSDNVSDHVHIHHFDEHVDEIVDEDASENVDEEDDQNSGGSDSDKRVEFQIHGFNGPNSYKFGYDTGLG